jgi:phosphoglycolate phosphatase-like HAD superfamily hydrolase
LIKKHLLICDIDGTLTDSVLIHQAAFVKAMQEIGVAEMDQQFHAYKHHTDLHIAKTIYEGFTSNLFSRAVIEQFEQILYLNISETLDIAEIKGAKKLLRLLEAETEFGLCFATGSMYKAAQYKLDKIGINFSPLQLVACNDIEDREGILQLAIENAKKHYQVDDFQRIISIGDGLWDLKTAQNLGLEFIGVGPKNKTILEAHGMRIHFNDFENFEISCLDKNCSLT